MDGALLVEAPDPLVGRTIGGRYHVEELIGRGGMGTVYRGRHQLVGRDVALKFLAPRYARDSAARARFLREARAANRIDHEHIIDITDFGETEDDLVFLVMEYLDGRPLSELTAQGALPPPRALKIASQVASALARAHELDVVHRDIKPENIFLLERRGEDFVKLLDFGLAMVAGQHRLTAAGKICGTPEYLSPEQARARDVTGAADQYALGVVLFEMLTGRVPFEGSAPEVVLHHLEDPPPPPSSVNPAVPKALDPLVLRMLAKEPAGRFADAFHVVEELTAAIRQLEPGRAGRARRPVIAPRTRSSVPPGAASAATQPWVDAAEETWRERLTLYRDLLPQVFASGVPAEHQRGLAEMERLVERARALRAQLAQGVLEAKQEEDRMRAARMRVGRAIDELGRDESRAARCLAAEEAAERAQAARLAEATEALDALRGALGAEMVRGPVTRELAERLRRAGGQAALWLEVEQACAERRARREQARREQEDLRFQIAQLKGRLGVLTAEGEAELSRLRAQADRLGSELSHALESLATVAGPITAALMAVPAARARLTGG